jgi:hypothetical protein
MPSESARVTTATESRYRIDYPNSRPRAVKVIALDPESRALVDQVAKLPWARAVFFTSLTFNGTATAPRAGESASMQAWLRDIAGQTKNLIEEIDTADLVVMVSSAGSDSQAALLIGEACAVRKVTSIGLIVQKPTTTDEETSRTLKHLRPVATMLVIANGEEYIEGMLTALRA